jgi:hypothetical protein
MIVASSSPLITLVHHSVTLTYGLLEVISYFYSLFTCGSVNVEMQLAFVQTVMSIRLP